MPQKRKRDQSPDKGGKSFDLPEHMLSPAPKRRAPLRGDAGDVPASDAPATPSKRHLLSPAKRTETPSHANRNLLSPRKFARRKVVPASGSADAASAADSLLSPAILTELLNAQDEEQRMHLKEKLFDRAKTINEKRKLTEAQRDQVRHMLIHTNNNTALLTEVKLQMHELAFGDWLFQTAAFHPMAFALTECFVPERLEEEKIDVKADLSLHQLTAVVRLFAPPEVKGESKRLVARAVLQFKWKAWGEEESTGCEISAVYAHTKDRVSLASVKGGEAAVEEQALTELRTGMGLACLPSKHFNVLLLRALCADPCFQILKGHLEFAEEVGLDTLPPASIKSLVDWSSLLEQEDAAHATR